MPDQIPFVIMLLLALAGLGLYRLQARKETANQLARRYCERHGLQFLDGTVAFGGIHRIRPGITLAVRFSFWYSVNGADRHQGHVSLVGKTMQSLYIQPQHVEPAADPDQVH